jgi:hypothetical protein
MTSAELTFLTDAPRFLFFTGKGGVGKTSIACAAALALAGAGKKVLLVSTDPASNVGQVFGVAIGNRITAIPAVTGLSALEIDPEAAAADYRERIVGPVRSHRSNIPASAYMPGHGKSVAHQHLHPRAVERRRCGQQQALMAARIEGQQHRQQGDQQQLHRAVRRPASKAEQLAAQGLEPIPGGTASKLQLQLMQLGHLAKQGLQAGGQLGNQMA